MDSKAVRSLIENVDYPGPSFDPVSDISDVPRMSTPTIGRLINAIVRQLPDGQQYVNVGVWHGYSLLAGMVGNPDKLCSGVDNFSQLGSPRNEFRDRLIKFGGPNHSFFDMGFEDYFKEYNKTPIGFYFYDGDHSYTSQLEGLKAAEPFFTDDCLIMVDDTNYKYPYQATMDFIAQIGNEYEVIFDKMTENPRDPIWWNGIMIIQKRGKKSDQ